MNLLGHKKRNEILLLHEWGFSKFKIHCYTRCGYCTIDKVLERKRSDFLEPKVITEHYYLNRGLSFQNFIELIQEVK